MNNKRSDSNGSAPVINELKSIVVCKLCGNKLKKIFQCSRCKSVYYCSRNCQKTDWRRHTPECSQLRHKRLEKVDFVVHKYKRLNVEKHYTVKTHKNMTVGDLMAGLSKVMGIKDEELEHMEYRINPACLKKKNKRVAGEFDRTYSSKKLWEFNLLDMFSTLPQFDLLDVTIQDSAIPYPQLQDMKYQKELLRLRKLLEKKEEEIAVLRLSNEKNVNVSQQKDKILIEQLRRKVSEQEEKFEQIVSKKEEEIKKVRIENEILGKRIVDLRGKVDALVKYNRTCFEEKFGTENNQKTSPSSISVDGNGINNPQLFSKISDSENVNSERISNERKEMLQNTIVQMKEDEKSVIESIKSKYESILQCKEEMTKTYQKSMTEIRKVQRELRKEQEEYLSKSKNHMFQIDVIKDLMGM